MQISNYFDKLEENLKHNYETAGEARKKGLDPSSEVEIPVARTLAERVIGLVSVLYPQINDQRIVVRILELEKQFGSLDPAVALTIAEEIAKEKFCKFTSHLEAVEAGIRVAIGYLTLGYVSSPIEGFIQLKVKKTAKGEEFFSPYYSGPIRSAGGTEAAFSLVVVDYLRELFGYALYDPSEEEVKRGVHECYEYHERITNLQYLPSEQEIEFLMKHLPVQLTGDPSEDREVYNYKDLARVETNFIRSGFCLVLGEGIAQKAPKVLKRIIKLKQQGFKLTGWDWLDDFVKLQKQIKEGKSSGGSRSGATYIQDLVAGRPVFSHPSESGGFRLRYGRCRNTGYSTLALHPATMEITGGFIAVGTQLKIEKPTKGCTIASCDKVDGPIVKLKNGDVVYIDKPEEAKRLYNETEEIIYLGDILVPYGDFVNRNHLLEKAGYVEQYWLEHLKKSGGESELFPSFDKAVELSEKYKIPLHPKFIFYWKEINLNQFIYLLDWLAFGLFRGEVFDLPWTAKDKEKFSIGKRTLELLGCEHKVGIENVVLTKRNAQTLLFNLGIKNNFELKERIAEIRQKAENKEVFDFINELCSLRIMDKSGTFIGARMGRPEKAKLRKLIGSPHLLFPVGEEGGRLRSVQEAVEFGSVTAEFPNYFCEDCNKDSVYPVCEDCKMNCKKLSYCRECEKMYSGKCEQHDLGSEYSQKKVDIRALFEKAKKQLGLRGEDIQIVLKGVKGTSNKDHSCEHLAKGLLRAKYNLNVNKDGTIRYDMTEMPLTHFKPKEVETSLSKLISLGYEKDILGNPLENVDQVLELLPHDIILPACPVSPDEKASNVFFSVAKFVDEELEKIYGVKKFYNLKSNDDLAGHLFGCMSPHTSATVIGRLIGFSKVQALLASPYIHAAMRRDCDGDEAAVMLLMDLLLNFSRKFLPSHRGGTQDAPLVLNMRIRANEVDDMIFDVDVSENMPLNLFEAAEKHAHPSEVKMEQVKARLGTGREFTDLKFSYDTSDINAGPLCSSYKTLPTMSDKVEGQMELCQKIRAVDTDDVARLIIERHFIRDTRGNLRKFSQQGFRCGGCNEKFRRPPLTGKCTNCGGKIIFTISEGSVLKYMQPALDLARKYNASPYLLESLELTEMYIQSIFGKEKEKQEALATWF